MKSDFKALGKEVSPSIIHISTHGYFISDSINNDEDEYKLSDNLAGSFQLNSAPENSLLNSGLIFAGANRVWKGEEPLEDTDDGILTAYEVADLNLRNTKLITLSACQTGLGDIKGTEGVFGLQRAFKKAGVDYIVMSLWNVSNKTISDFMETFYNKLLKGMELKKAFSISQLEMMKKYRRAI